MQHTSKMQLIRQSIQKSKNQFQHLVGESQKRFGGGTALLALKWLLSANSGENLFLFFYRLFGPMVIIDTKFMTYLTYL